MQLDRALFAWLYAGQAQGSLYLAMVCLSFVGGGWGMMGLVPLCFVRRARSGVLGLIATLLAVTLVVFLIKAIVGRTRPFACVPGVHALCAPPTDPSFPSGHAAGAFAFAVFVSAWVLRKDYSRLTKWLLIGLLGSFAVGVAASRVLLGVHFPSDVLAGGVLGSAMGWVGARVALRSRGVEPRWSESAPS